MPLLRVAALAWLQVPPLDDLSKFKLPTITVLGSDGSIPIVFAYQPWPVPPFKSLIFVAVSGVVVQVTPPSVDFPIALILEAFDIAAYNVFPLQSISTLEFAPYGIVYKVVASFHPVVTLAVAGLSVYL